MEPINAAKEVIDGIAMWKAIGSFFAGILTSTVITTWNISKFANRVSTVEKSNKEIADAKVLARLDAMEKAVLGMSNIMYLEKGGLNLITEDRHKDICITNQELFGKDIEAVLKDVEFIKQSVARIEHFPKEISAMRLAVESINEKMGNIQKTAR